MQVNILQYLESGNAREFSDRVAIVDSERSFTFSELEHLSKSCAELILRRTDVICKPVAVYLPKSAKALFPIAISRVALCAGIAV